MKLFEPFAWRDHAQPSRDGHLAGPAGFAFAAASAEPAGLAGLSRLNADVQARADRVLGSSGRIMPSLKTNSTQITAWLSTSSLRSYNFHPAPPSE